MRLFEKFRKAVPLTESDRTERRWARINEESRLRGCMCGEPATKAVWHGPHATWSCDEHVGINQWTGRKRPDGSTEWIPVPPTTEEAESLAKWETGVPRQYTRAEINHGGVL